MVIRSVNTYNISISRYSMVAHLLLTYLNDIFHTMAQYSKITQYVYVFITLYTVDVL